MYEASELLGAPSPGININLCPASVTKKVYKYAHPTVIYRPKAFSFRGLRPLDPTPICVLPVSQIDKRNMLI